MTWRAAVAVVSLGLGGSALAQEMQAENVVPEDERREQRSVKQAVRETDLNVRLLGGLGNYTGDLDQQTRVGPTMGVAVSATRWNLVGAEIGYESSRNPVSSPLAPEDAALWRHNISGLAKIGPWVNDSVMPYLGAGIGISYLNANAEAEPLYRNDVFEEVPLAAGIDVRRGALFGGVRATYRLLFGEEFVDQVQPTGTEGGLFIATLNVGGTF